MAAASSFRVKGSGYRCLGPVLAQLRVFPPDFFGAFGAKNFTVLGPLGASLRLLKGYGMFRIGWPRATTGS